jgi:hypothetical protein
MHRPVDIQHWQNKKWVMLFIRLCHILKSGDDKAPHGPGRIRFARMDSRHKKATGLGRQASAVIANTRSETVKRQRLTYASETKAFK